MAKHIRTDAAPAPARPAARTRAAHARHVEPARPEPVRQDARHGSIMAVAVTIALIIAVYLVTTTLLGGSPLVHGGSPSGFSTITGTIPA